ncbi:MAG: class I SAM-dependent methyltransferase, partial [Bacteroidales bacterium]|nr:class I SAM-dependent methyltransferase [Bacteroidales bacterium]
MAAADDFWNFYWEMRLAPLENLGKQAAILAISRLIRTLAEQGHPPLRMLELGCGEGQVIGQLLDAHAQICDTRASVGVDYNAQSLAVCRRDYPGFKWVEGDFTDPEILAGLGKFDIMILVNAMHEVFSDALSADLSGMDVPAAKLRVEESLAGAAGY